MSTSLPHTDASTPHDWPDVWGPGELLAFSGCDGATDWFTPFVLHTGQRVGQLTLRRPGECTIDLGLAEADVSLLLGDCMTATTPAGPAALAFLDS